MKIERLKKKTSTFSDIQIGECFVYEQILYLKLKEETYYFQQDIDGPDTYPNAVSLVDYSVTSFPCPNTRVTPANFKLVEY